MYRCILVILLLMAVAPSVRDSFLREGIVAMIKEAEPDFSRDPKELEDLIVELEEKTEKDIFEKTLLDELKRYKEELGRFPDLARASGSSSL